MKTNIKRACPECAGLGERVYNPTGRAPFNYPQKCRMCNGSGEVVGWVVVASNNGKVHALDPSRIGRTLCGRRDEFEWKWTPMNLVEDLCARCSGKMEMAS